MTKTKHRLGATLSEVMGDDVMNPRFAEAFANRRRIHEIARAIRALRERHGLTQAELAGLVGMKQPAIARLETSQSRVARFDTLGKIATALGAQLQLSLGVVDEKKPIVRVVSWGTARASSVASARA